MHVIVRPYSIGNVCISMPKKILTLMVELVFISIKYLTISNLGYLYVQSFMNALPEASRKDLERTCLFTAGSAYNGVWFLCQQTSRRNMTLLDL